ncbi:anti-Muellerian hormone type-2 receptor [Spea bombifrons]|uniref:anti-Muellerian hormone type-2 receptor n=1 Tax=Spea bombifrons TaxID=233779 RepID=UPI00234AA68D|nr:anti-Muellerian hormone type-2 receptor [Spea bombifrons]
MFSLQVLHYHAGPEHYLSRLQTHQLIGMSHETSVLSLLLLSSTMFLPVVHLEGILCALFANSSFPVKFPISQFGVEKEPGKIHCEHSNCCMGMWSELDGQLQPVVLSCFPDSAVCGSAVCSPVERESMYYCMCSSDMCNANITRHHKPSAPTQAELETCARWNLSCDWIGEAREQLRNASSFSKGMNTHKFIVILFLIMCVLVFIKVLRKLKIRKDEILELQDVLTQDECSSPTLPVEGLTLLQALREEQLEAHLWLGLLHGRGVIIKSFPPPLREVYQKEWRILSLLSPLQHENIVRLLAAGGGDKGPLEHHQLLVLQHYPEGSLRNYLTGHTTDWVTACRMAASLARGLAFLHADLWRGSYKPAIAHRDLSSDNILVQADCSCVISNFGLSVVLESIQMKNKKEQDPDLISMTGTLRYMSPEMLDGFLNLVSWEMALTQADVYSLGLLLWEIFIRCNDLYEDHQAPDFQVVFSEELGPNPTLCELQTLVVENKERPRLPKPWTRNVQLSLALWETLEDCWDPDSEARLTAQCMEQRLCNLCPLQAKSQQGEAITETTRNCPVP